MPVPPHSTAVGFIAVAIAIFFFGSFGVFTKTRALRVNHVDPMLVQCFMSGTIFVSSWLVAAYTGTFNFTYLGILSACLWVPANILATTSIRLAGLGIAQGTWSGVTIVVSFIWGSVIFHDSPIQSVALKVLGVAVLVIGIIGVATTVSEDGPQSQPQPHAHRINQQPDDAEAEVEAEAEAEEQDLLEAHSRSSAAPKKSKRRAMLGLLCACILGVLNGCMLVPMKYVPAEAGGIGFAMSFGIGVLAVTAVIVPVYYWIMKPVDGPTWYKARVALVPCTMAGVFWNVGNIGSVVATQSQLGLTLGFPLCQCALLVSAMWGFFVYKEIKGRAKTVQLFMSSVVLCGGAALMSLVG